MKNFLYSLPFFLIGVGAYAQSNLTACQGSDVPSWTNCFGSVAYPKGNKYVGEFSDGKFNGQGTFPLLIGSSGTDTAWVLRDN